MLFVFELLFSITGAFNTPWMTVSCFTWCIHVGFAEGDFLLLTLVNNNFSPPFGIIFLELCPSVEHANPSHVIHVYSRSVYISCQHLVMHGDERFSTF